MMLRFTWNVAFSKDIRKCVCKVFILYLAKCVFQPSVFCYCLWQQSFEIDINLIFFETYGNYWWFEVIIGMIIESTREIIKYKLNPKVKSLESVAAFWELEDMFFKINNIKPYTLFYTTFACSNAFCLVDAGY